ncbi:MAG: hypothetical protein LBD82_08205 [Deltaproteobacteria bacterium]|jgi:hypothetical protein|nr:hypothetical protein [Deltaproteobacteria bacterium]
MIVIDGRTSDMQVNNFANLEEILVQAAEDEHMENRIVTDVLVNDEAFSELYPHQAEDIEIADIRKVEIRTISIEKMASDITTELYKVITVMTAGASKSSALMRKSEIGGALEIVADVIDVTRHFLGMIAILRKEFSIDRDHELTPLAEQIGDLLDEMSEMINQEDWFMLADLTEYEFLPACESWNNVIANLAHDIAEYKAA